MLEVCPSIAAARPKLELHPLSIGGKADPVRLVFDAPSGEAVNISLIDLGNRFRLIVNEVDRGGASRSFLNFRWLEPCGNVNPTSKRPSPPGFTRAARTTPSTAIPVATEHIEDFAELAGVELVVIDEHTKLRELKNVN